MSADERIRVSARRVALTAVGTVLIVGLEYLLLTTVYDRAGPVRADRVVVATLSGELTQVSPARAHALAPQAVSALAQLSASAVSPQVSAARAAAAAVAAGDGSVASLQASVASLGRALAQRQRQLDAEAHRIYGGLLVVVSFGWMVWFRHLVRRHRSLQREVTEQQARAVSEQRLAALVRNAADIVIVCDQDGTVGFVAPSILKVLGIEPAAVTGVDVTTLLLADHRPLMRSLLLTSDAAERQVRAQMAHSDGRIRDVEGTIADLTADSAVGGLVLTVRDITERVELERQLTHRAFHDSLTGLANRQLFADRLNHALTRRSRTGSGVIVLICDLDEFKNVNDSLGHGVGDRVLIEVASRARDVVRVGDTIARLGGDEFAVLMEDCDLGVARACAEQLLDVLVQPLIVGGQSISVRASFGLAEAAGTVLSGDELLRNADVAMYLAKDRGKGTIAIYDEHLHAETLDRLALRADLQRAIRSGELVLYVQPTVDLLSGTIAGFEALVRWRHPTRGLLSPDAFIPLAEQTGLIQPLGSWVLRRACEIAVELGAGVPAGRKKPRMSVNVAAQQLVDPGFGDEVLRVLSATGLPAQLLTLEITESVVLQDMAAVVGQLTALRAQGVCIAIDDFGTGYSSLAYLRNLPLDILKVDKSFVDRVTTDEYDAALTRSILSMSESINLTTIAEGVETPDQAIWLRDARCGYGQGFLWSKPVPVPDAHALLQSGRPFAALAGFERRRLVASRVTP